MRLTCPNCAAVYAIADDALPPGGKHVQCSACHTRWFARPETPAPAALSEDEILARLDTRSRRPALAVVPSSAVPAMAPTPVAPPVAPVSVEPPLLRPTPLRPAPRVEDVPPALLRPAPRVEDVPPAPLRSPHEPGPLRPRVGAEAPRAPVVAAPRRQSRFGRGFGLGLLLGAAGLGLYLGAAPLAERVPALAPQAAALMAAGDALRLEIETRLGPLRDRARDALAAE